MDFKPIISNVSKHIPLDSEEQSYFTSLLLQKPLKQGAFIEEAGITTQHFIYVNAGCLMTYYVDKQGHDHVIQFATTGWWTGDLHSFTKQIPSIYMTRALVNSEVLLLPRGLMDTLVERIPKFERYLRILFQNSLITHQHRIIQNFAATAKERYLAFQEKYPTLEQYVPLKYIASYLGITPEFLSKIRRQLAK